jgi:streptogramin lyase
MPNQVLKVDHKSGRLTKYYLPTQEPDRADVRGIAADADGNLWAAETEAGKLVKLDYRIGGFTEYAPPTNDPGPYSVDVDTSRNLIWFSEIYSDRIGRYDPRTNTFVEYPHPDSDSDVQRVEVDRSHPNRVWWSSPRNDKIGYIEVIE